MGFWCNSKDSVCRRRFLRTLLLLLIFASTLLVSLWGFVYQSAPSGESCWAIRSWTPGSFKQDQRTWYKALAGTDVRLAWEDDADFEVLHAFYVVAVISPAVGLFLSSAQLERDSSHGASRSYTKALALYFAVGFILNAVTQVTFVRNRCNDHNAHFLLPHNAIPRAARILPRVGWTDIATSAAKLTKAVYLTVTLVGGFVTNSMMEHVLLRKANALASARRWSFCIGCAKMVNFVLLAITVIAGPVAFSLFLRMMDVGDEDFGGVDGGEVITLIFNIGAASFATLQVFVYVVLMATFVSLSEKHSRLYTTIVTTCTLLIISSTLCCYGNMALMLTNAYLLLPISSIINDVCMVTLSFVGEVKEDHFTKEGQQLCEEGHNFSQNQKEQGEFPEVMARSDRRPSTHSINSIISVVEETMKAVRSIGSNHSDGYRAFSNNGGDYRPCTPVQDALGTSSVPHTPATPTTSLTATSMLASHSLPGLLTPTASYALTSHSLPGPLTPTASYALTSGPLTPTASLASGALTPRLVVEDFQPQAPEAPIISNDLLRDLKAMKSRPIQERRSASRAYSPHIAYEYDCEEPLDRSM